jgi:PAS domain S-box-containing protein
VFNSGNARTRFTTYIFGKFAFLRADGIRKMFSPRSRIAMGLTGMMVSVVLVALSLGILPDYRESTMEGRARLCEAVAMNGSLLVRQRDLMRFEKILQLVVDRYDDVRSAGVRRDDGSLAVEVGNHSSLWMNRYEGHSTDTHMHVAVKAKDDQVWGWIELCFVPISESGWWGFICAPRSQFVIFVGVGALLSTLLYLRRALSNMDPSKVVPGRVRSALDTLAEGLLVLDRGERIMLANQAFADIVGEAPQKLMGRLASSLPWISAHEATGWEYPWEMALRDQAHLNGVMMHLKDGKGERRSFMVNCTPIQGNEGDTRGVLASFEDVTQLEATQQELSRSIEAADAANRAKSEFLARMSHEIRTPMNAILGFTDVLRRGFESDQHERQEHLNTIHASGQHLLDLINDILDLSKVESGRLEVERIRCGPLQLIHEAVSVLRGQAEAKGLRLCYEAPEGLPETIITDPMRFRQVLTNLVGNAIKFTEDGEVRVTARLIKSDGKSQLAIEVADTGLGIPDGTLQSIFDPFVQADTSVTRRFGGTGLGLAISRRFARALGGDLTVESERGQGSVFTFTVDTGPLEGTRTVSCDSFVEEEQRDDTDHEILGALASGRILVVDDGESNRKLIHLVLERAGVTVESACDGREAVDAATANPFDLILMDMQMPVMDGFTATSTLREQGYKAPIIALTADAMKGTEAKCLAAGCSGFLTKPVDMDKLVRVVGEVLGESGDLPLVKRTPSADAPDVLSHEPLYSTLPTDDLEFCEIVVEFAGRLNVKLSEMRQATSTNDYAELARLAHWLKGSGGMAGFAAFTAPARELEQAAKSKQPAAQVKVILKEIETIAQCIIIPDIPLSTPE